MNNELKDKVQQDALKAWIKANKKGSCEIITGLGKTILALHALYTMPKDDKLHLFLAEQIDRQTDLIKDIVKYNQIFNRDVLNDYNLQFQCYQTVYRWKDKEVGLVIADEIPDSLSPSYSEFYFNNSYDAIIGLSATINRKVEYIDKDNKVFTKGDLLDKIAPVCFKYTMNQGQTEGTSRKLNIYVINHELDEINKTVKSGSLKNPFYQTEKIAYTYWDKMFKKNLFLEPGRNDNYDEFQNIKNLKIRLASNKRKDILYKLDSKITVIKQLLDNINGQSIIFGNSLDSLLKITPNVVSSRNNISKNNLIRNSFDLGKIKVIGSFKKLEQGANLNQLDNVILHSYYGVEGKIIQRLGRNRINGDKVGSVFVLVTKDTQEEKWWSNATENMTEFNIVDCNNIEDCIIKYKENERNNL